MSAVAVVFMAVAAFAAAYYDPNICPY